MLCPRCHSVWDTEKSACTGCGLAIRIQRQAPPVDSRQIPQPETGVRALKPGVLLLNGRYRLYACQGKQVWLSGAYEATWLAQDAQRGGALVRMSEFVLPGKDAIVKQSILRAATMAFHAISRHAHVPTLLDVFSDQERSFLVFEHVEGESLLERMQRTRRFLPEREVIECCLQMTEVLDFLAQQSPPLVHGLIRPENILVGRTNSHYMLLNFSVVLAGNATQFVMGVPRLQLSAYTAPEFARGRIDARADMYALLATAYLLVTGRAPTRSRDAMNGAHQNQAISPQFEAILAKGLNSGKGLRPDITQRYQYPAELQRDLLAMSIGPQQATASASPAPFSGRFVGGPHGEPVGIRVGGGGWDEGMGPLGGPWVVGLVAQGARGTTQASPPRIPATPSPMGDGARSPNKPTSESPSGRAQDPLRRAVHRQARRATQAFPPRSPVPPAPTGDGTLLRAPSNDSVANHPILQNLASNMDIEEPASLLPRAEELPPLLKSNDARQAMIYLVSLLVWLVLVVVVGRGLM